MSPRRSLSRGLLHCEPLEDRVVPAIYAPLASAADGAADGLRSAVIAANTNLDADNTINLEAGIYTLSVANAGGAEENAAATGDLDLANLAAGSFAPADKHYVLQGAGAKQTIIDAADLDRVFHTIGAHVTVEFRDLTIQNGRATTDGTDASVAGAVSALGGGVLVDSAIVSFNRVAIVNNEALGANQGTKTDARGGGVYASNGRVNITASTLSGNRAQGGDAATGGLAFGGAAAAAKGSLVQIIDSTVSGNFSIQGVSSTPAPLGSGAQGGGLDVANGATAEVKNSTIADNQANSGGGVHVEIGGTFNAESSLFADNQANFSGPNVSGNFANASHNLVADGSGSSLFAVNPDANGNIVGNSVARIDPHLGSLADNGGPTQTHSLNAGSPAIDQGSNTAGLATDQRGATRVFNGTADIGAFEFTGNGNPTPPTTPIAGYLAGGVDAGAAPRVRVLRPDHTEVANFLAYEPSFLGGVRVAIGDVNGDGVADVVTATATGAVHVKVIDGTRLQQIMPNGQIADSAVLASFYAYDPAFAGGASLAVARVNGDNRADIIVGTAAGPSHVKVIDGALIDRVLPDGTIDPAYLLGSFYAYGPNFAGGVNVAAGDVNGDGLADVVIGAGPGARAHIKVVDARLLGNVQSDGQVADFGLLASFFGFAGQYSGGVTVAAGDVDGDGHADVIFGTMSGAGSLDVADGTRLTQTFSGIIQPTALRSVTFPFGNGETGGLRLATVDANGDGRADIIVTPGRSGFGTIRIYNGRDLDTIGFGGNPASAQIDNFTFMPSLRGGMFIGGA